MTKKNRLRKAWQRNWDLYMCKGVYFLMGKPVKHQLTPRQVYRILRREEIDYYGMTAKNAEKKGIVKFWKPENNKQQ